MKIWVPPYLIRRLVMAPAVVLLAIVVIVTSPLWLLLAAAASPFLPGRWRALRVLWFLVAYLFFEAVMLTALLMLWLVSGFGHRLREERFVAAHYALAAWWLRQIVATARHVFNLRIRLETPDEVAPRDRPVLVFSRHAGPGDSLLLAHALLNYRRRRPRIVLKDLLQLDPVIDVALNRVGAAFVPTTGPAGPVVIEAVRSLAASLTPSDALLLFPEGGNFTPGRWRRAITALRSSHRDALADRATRLRHVLPPKPGGAMAAISAAPGADVIFVGHAGLERFAGPGDVWRGMPMDAAVTTRMWRVPAEDIPPPAEQESWLYDQWELLDRWIDERLGGSREERRPRR